jgi:hypothetical protein
MPDFLLIVNNQDRAHCRLPSLSQKLQWKIRIMVTYFEKTGCKIRPCTKRCLQFPGYLDSKPKSYTDSGYRPCRADFSIAKSGFVFPTISGRGKNHNTNNSGRKQVAKLPQRRRAEKIFKDL